MNRYADFYVHRQIHAALKGNTTSVYDARKVSNIADARQLATNRCNNALKRLYLAKQMNWPNYRYYTGQLSTVGVVYIPSVNCHFDVEWENSLDGVVDITVILIFKEDYEVNIHRVQKFSLLLPPAPKKQV